MTKQKRVEIVRQHLGHGYESLVSDDPYVVAEVFERLTPLVLSCLSRPVLHHVQHTCWSVSDNESDIARDIAREHGEGIDIDADVDVDGAGYVTLAGGIMTTALGAVAIDLDADIHTLLATRRGSMDSSDVENEISRLRDLDVVDVADVCR